MDRLFIRAGQSERTLSARHSSDRVRHPSAGRVLLARRLGDLRRPRLTRRPHHIGSHLSHHRHQSSVLRLSAVCRRKLSLPVVRAAEDRSLVAGSWRHLLRQSGGRQPVARGLVTAEPARFAR